MIFSSNRFYDVSKYTAMIALPAVSTFYFTIAQIWNLPKAPEVSATLAALSVFVGAIVGLSAKKYNSDEQNFEGLLDWTGTNPVTGHPDIQLTFTKDPSDIISRGGVSRFRVGTSPVNKAE